jgi:hypothetical protein
VTIFLLKNQIGLRRLRLRRMKFVQEQFFLAAGCAEHQATGALYHSDDNTRSSSHYLV